MKLLPLALTAAALSNLASATVVNIDFATDTSGGYTGFGAAETVAGHTTWNVAAYAGSSGSVALSDMVDSTGAPTFFDFSLTGLDTLLGEGSQNPAGEMERSGGSGGYSPLMRDYVRVDGVTSGTVATANGKISGLVVGGTYDLYFYGQGEIMNPASLQPSLNRGQNSLFTVNGNSKQTSWDGTLLGDNQLVEGIEFVKFTAVATNGGAEGGVITFSFSNVVASGATPNAATDLADNGNTSGNTASRYGALNGFQIVSVVPEPSAALLSLLGMAGLLRRRR
jgi:hypothetical protein